MGSLDVISGVRYLARDSYENSSIFQKNEGRKNNMELIEQSVQYTFNNEKYTDGFKKRILKNVRKDATAEGISKVGDAISGLQGDKLGAAVLIQKHGVALVSDSAN